MTETGSKQDRSWLAFALMLLAELWLAHAAAFFAHEYAHSFTAWVLGWKANPLALHYGHATVGNLLVMIDIDENVDYGPIFAAGHGVSASLIAVAGMLIGNGVLYLVARWRLTRAALRGGQGVRLFWLLLAAAGVGNFIDYVPVRTFTPLYDMGTFARGLGLSPWVVLLALGVPIAFATWEFFFRLLPGSLDRIAPDSLGRQRVLVMVATFAVFVFYGSPGLGKSLGAACHWISWISMGVVFPVMTWLCWPRFSLSRRAIGRS